jgi:hypothetical protein
VKSVDFHDQDSKLIFLTLCIEERLSETLGKNAQFGGQWSNHEKRDVATCRSPLCPGAAFCLL